MVITVFKSSKESQERCITRFTKKCHRKVQELRGRRFHSKSDTKGQVRESAIMREHYRALRKKNRFY